MGGVLETSAAMACPTPDDTREAHDDRQVEKDDLVRENQPIVQCAEVVPVSDPVSRSVESLAHLASERLVGPEGAGRVVAVQVEMDHRKVHRGSQPQRQPGLPRAAVPDDRYPRHFLSEASPPVLSAATKASWGTSTRPTIFMRFLPSFCFSRSLRLRVMSPP